MISHYVHLELDNDVPTPSGYYTPLKEGRLKYDAREVLYVISHAVVDASCCGLADFTAALVPGFIVKWQGEKNQRGRWVSEVEPVTDERARKEIGQRIREVENITQVEFW